MTGDEITLTLPRERDFHRIAHLVLGGLAARLDLTFETLEDLQLALAGLLAEPDAAGEVTVRLRVEEATLRASVGPFSPVGLRRRLEQEQKDELGLRRLLETVSDDVEVSEAAEGAWVEVTKSVVPVETA